MQACLQNLIKDFIMTVKDFQFLQIVNLQKTLQRSWKKDLLFFHHDKETAKMLKFFEWLYKDL